MIYWLVLQLQWEKTDEQMYFKNECVGASGSAQYDCKNITDSVNCAE